MRGQAGDEAAPRGLASASETERRRLELHKLRIEMQQLSGSRRRRSRVAWPIAAALVTLAFAHYLGLFDFERHRSELAGREASLVLHELHTEIPALEIEKAKLQAEQRELNAEKDLLLKQIAQLRQDAASAAHEGSKPNSDAMAH